MRKTLTVLGLFLLLVLLPADAIGAPVGEKEALNPDFTDLLYPKIPGSFTGSDQCIACQRRAWTEFKTTVDQACLGTWPVNMFSWTIALCIQTAAWTRDRALVNCVTDYNCTLSAP